MAKFIDLDTGLPALLNKVKAWVNSKLSTKQDALVSGTNIKTVNNTSILGSGTIAITGLPAVTSSDNGKFLMVDNGAWTATTVPFVTVYSGSTTPSSSTGSDGDIYLQTE